MIIPSTSLFNRRILRFPLKPLPVLVEKNGAGANAKHRNPIRLVAYLTPSDWYSLRSSERKSRSDSAPDKDARCKDASGRRKIDIGDEDDAVREDELDARSNEEERDDLRYLGHVLVGGPCYPKQACWEKDATDHDRRESVFCED
jgi:hypothetical protein